MRGVLQDNSDLAFVQISTRRVSMLGTSRPLRRGKGGEGRGPFPHPTPLGVPPWPGPPSVFQEWQKTPASRGLARDATSHPHPLGVARGRGFSRNGTRVPCITNSGSLAGAGDRGWGGGLADGQGSGTLGRMYLIPGRSTTGPVTELAQHQEGSSSATLGYLNHLS